MKSSLRDVISLSEFFLIIAINITNPIDIIGNKW